MADKDLQMQRKKSDGTFDKYYPKTKTHLVVDDTTGQSIKEQYNNIVTKKANLIDNKIPTNELPLASQFEAEAGISDSTLMTPLKVRQFIVSNGGSGGGVTNVVFQSGKKYWKYTASQATNTIEIPAGQFNPINDVLEIVDDNNLILLKDINYVISNNTVTLVGYDLIAGESLHFLITQTSYDYNSLMNKPEIVSDYSGGTNKIASAESVKQLFQLASDGKTNVATEINAKGVTTTVTETFASLANKIKTYLTKIEGTAIAGDVLSGKTFKNSSGNLGTGTIPSKTAQTYTPGTTNQSIAAGQYLSGIQTISGSTNLVAGNIKSGVNIFGVVGNYAGGATKELLTFTSNTSWTIPNGVFFIEVYLVGGGGGGCAGMYNTSKYSTGGVGGRSGSVASNLFKVTPGTVLNITVGAGGVPKAYETIAGYVYNGGESSISGAASLSTAGSNVYDGVKYGVDSGTGEKSTGVLTNFPSGLLSAVYSGAGGGGRNDRDPDTTYYGDGGTSPGGGKGGNGYPLTAGSNATAYGSGGGGGGANSSGASGGYGKSGIVYIYYTKIS